MLKRNILKIKDIVLDERLYPRVKPIESVIVRYAKEMKKGDRFPPPFVGWFKGRYYLIDGRHRLEASKVNGEKYIKCEIKDNFPNFNAMFMASFTTNQKHGHQLSDADRHKVAIRLSEMKYDVGDIAKLTGVALRKVESNVRGKIRNTLIKRSIEKGEIKSVLKEEIKQEESVPLMSKEDEQFANLNELYNYVSVEKFRMDDSRIEKMIRKIKKTLHKRYPKL